MPIYEYECLKCGKSEERLIMGRYKPPKCCGKTMKRLMSISLIQFKGDGFYATEYGSQTHNARRESGVSEVVKEGGE